LRAQHTACVDRAARAAVRPLQQPPTAVTAEPPPLNCANCGLALAAVTAVF